ncbi:hypothetical protein SH661x_002290 [Planctomicrobium sp. SH661]
MFLLLIAKSPECLFLMVAVLFAREDRRGYLPEMIGSPIVGTIQVSTVDT